MKKNHEVSFTLSLADMYLVHASIRHLAASLDHVVDNVLERREIDLQEDLETLGLKVDNIIKALEEERNAYN